MAVFASGSQHGMRFIKENEFGVAPENPDMRALRHTSSSLVLNKDSFQSNELRRDAQISDLRHGVKQISGDVGIEFSYGEYDELLAAAVRGEWKDDELVAGITQQYFTIERIFNDIKKVETFTGCAVNTLSLDIQTNNMVTGTIGFIGKGVSFSENGVCVNELPSYTYSPLDGFHGSMKEGGVPIAVITGINLSIDNGIEAANVIGSDEAAALVFGRINVTGTVSAYFENMDLLDKFVNEIESELEIVLGDGGPGSYIIYLPRIKYSSGTNNVDGEGQITLDMPFQALLDDCTGTNIKITRIPTDADKSVPCTLTWSGTAITETEAGVYDVVTATLEGKTFNGADGKELPGVQVTNLPAGVKCEVVRTSATTAEIRLAGEPADRTNPGAFNVVFPASSFSKGFCHCEGFEITGRTQDMTITWAQIDTEPPVMQASSPANGATDIAVDAPIVLTFPEPIKAGTGEITISDNATDIRTISVAKSRKRFASAGTATIEGASLTIALAQPLAYSTEYELTIPEGAITDEAGNPFAGIAAGEMKFTTAAAPNIEAPTLESSVPANGATDIDPETVSSLVLNFSEDVKAGTGSVTIAGSGDSKTVDIAKAQIAGKSATFAWEGKLANDVEYSVTAPAGIVADEAGNAFAGIEAGTLSFHTVKANEPEVPADTDAPTLVSSTPEHEATDVAIDGTLVLTFSENVKIGTGELSITDGEADTRTIAVQDAYISDTRLSVTLDSPLSYGEQYSVTVPEGFVVDEAGNAFAGIMEGELAFTTAAQAPEGE